MRSSPMKPARSWPRAVTDFVGLLAAAGSTVSTLADERDATERLMVILSDQIVNRLYATPGLFRMKLSPREAEGYFAKPDADKAGLADLRRGRDARGAETPTGSGGFAGPKCRRGNAPDPHCPAPICAAIPPLLLDAVKAVGFFPVPARFCRRRNGHGGPRRSLPRSRIGRPVTPRSCRDGRAAQTQFENPQGVRSTSNGLCCGYLRRSPIARRVERILAEAGLQNIPRDSMSAIAELATGISPGDFAQTIEKLSLYKRGDAVGTDDRRYRSLRARSTEAALDDVLNVVAEGRAGEIGPLIRRLQAQGTNAVSLCIGATRHFRTLYACASDPGGAAQGIGKLRPPVYGKRRDRIVAAGARLGRAKTANRADRADRHGSVAALGRANRPGNGAGRAGHDPSGDAGAVALRPDPASPPPSVRPNARSPDRRSADNPLSGLPNPAFRPRRTRPAPRSASARRPAPRGSHHQRLKSPHPSGADLRASIWADSFIAFAQCACDGAPRFGHLVEQEQFLRRQAQRLFQPLRQGCL